MNCNSNTDAGADTDDDDEAKRESQTGQTGIKSINKHNGRKFPIATHTIQLLH